LAGMATGGFSGWNTESAINVQQALDLQLYATRGSTDFIMVAEMNLKNEHVHFKSVSSLKIQNRSKSEGGGTESTNIDNNPLIGYLYHFKDGAPRSKLEGARLFEHVGTANGAVLATGAEFAGVNYTQSLAEPPVPATWSNLKTGRKVLLNPGQIMMDKISYTTSAPLYKFLYNMGLGTGGTVTSVSQRMRGKSAMFSLEDVINVNGSENITVAYEINRVTMCYCTTMKPAVSYGRFNKLTYSK